MDLALQSVLIPADGPLTLPAGERGSCATWKRQRGLKRGLDGFQTTRQSGRVQTSKVRHQKNACYSGDNLESSVQPAHLRRLNTCVNMRQHGAGPRGIFPSQPNGLAGAFPFRDSRVTRAVTPLNSFFESVRITRCLALIPSGGDSIPPNPVPKGSGCQLPGESLGRMKRGNEAVKLTVLRKLADPGVEGCLCGRKPSKALMKGNKPAHQTLKEQHRSFAVQSDFGVSERGWKAGQGAVLSALRQNVPKEQSHRSVL